MDQVIQSSDEENPDYLLVQIDAANPDFQAQMNPELQESYLTPLLIKALKVKSNQFLFQIMGEVQRALYEKGIQLVEHRYNNGTEYIKFDGLQNQMNERNADLASKPLVEQISNAHRVVGDESSDSERDGQCVEHEEEQEQEPNIGRAPQVEMQDIDIMKRRNERNNAVAGKVVLNMRCLVLSNKIQ